MKEVKSPKMGENHKAIYGFTCTLETCTERLFIYFVLRISLVIIAKGTTSHVLERPVEHSNMYPSLRGPNSAAFPPAKSQQK